ncbi:MAG: hypothetical protein Q8L81_05775 [Bacteroidota bacterium]|nr:hypothetical protein [Bacteroidota bacterium]
MKVTKDNYESIVKEIGVENLSESLKKGYSLVDRVTKGGKDWSKYHMFKKAIDSVFEALGLLYEKNKKSATSSKVDNTQPINKTSPESNYKKSSYKTTADHGEKQKKPIVAPTYEKPKVKGKGVELIGTEVSFIKRFVGLHNKTKTKDQVGSFIRSLQKAIVEKRIRKTSRYANTIREIQSQLVSIYKKMANSIKLEFEPKDLNRYYKIAGAEIVMPSIRFIKAFVSLSGKEITKHKAKNLLDRVKKALASKIVNAQDRYYKEVKTVINSLEGFLSKQGVRSLSIRESQLNGLQIALQGCGCEELKGLVNIIAAPRQSSPKDDGVMTVQEARKAQFRSVPLTGEWLKLIGKMCLPTSFLVYGLGGSGKTSFVLLFTQYLASIGYKILYVAREQYNTPTFTELLNRLNIDVGNNFQIVKDLKVLNPKNFDFIVLDSKDDMEIGLAEFVTLKEKYSHQSFILISQATKDGNFTGNGRWRNVVDVMLYAEKGILKSGIDKNRWGGSAELQIFINLST